MGGKGRKRMTSATAGSKFVVLERICVMTVARTMCHNVRNIGKGKLNVLMTALLNKI
jgi:hypothetical protein